MMQISPQGIEAIKRHEGLRLQAYLDSAGVPTIGVGHTAGVKMGDVISVEQADQFLREDLAWVEAAIRNHVKVPLTQNQYDALCSLIFNIGAGGFQESTLLRKLNAGDYAGAADEFPRWNKATVQGALTVIPGLSTRRTAERAMFLNGAPAPAQPAQPAHETSIGEKIMAFPAVVAALLPTLIEQLPKLGKLFGSGSEVSERNLAAATTVMEIVQQATSTPNAQAAVEAIVANPAVREQAAKAIEEKWFELTESGGGGIEGARKAALEYSHPEGPRFWFNPAFWITLILLTMPFMLVVDVLFVHPENYAGELRTQIVTGVLLVISIAGGYWLGTSFSSARKTEIIQK